MNALVSICIPNYNMQHFIGEALRSALEQTYTNIEVIVLDNASSDGSWELIQAVATNDLRIKCFRNDYTIRMVENYNKVLNYASGTYINLLSADDLIESKFVEKCICLFDDYDNLGYVFSDRLLIDNKGKIMPTNTFYEDSAIIKGIEEARVNIIGSHNAPSQMLIKRFCLDKVGGFDERFECSFDINCTIKLNLNYDLGYLKDKLCKYRTHSEMSTSFFKKSKLNVMEIYQTKLSILDELPDGAKQLAKYKDDMLRNFAKMCIYYAETFLLENDVRLSKEYLHLAASFWIDIELNDLYRFLLNCIDRKHEWCSEEYYEAKQEYFQRNDAEVPQRPPYELPPGSVVLSE